MEKLNGLEIALLKAIIDENKNMYPFLEEHFNHLRVSKRTFTGVGIYTDFQYELNVRGNNPDVLLSSQKQLIMQGLTNEVTYVLDITNGKIAFLEIVTNGNDVLEDDKEISNFRLI